MRGDSAEEVADRILNATSYPGLQVCKQINVNALLLVAAIFLALRTREFTIGV